MNTRMSGVMGIVIITDDDVCKVLMKVKLNLACGVDIYAEHLRYASPQLDVILNG